MHAIWVVETRLWIIGYEEFLVDVLLDDFIERDECAEIKDRDTNRDIFVISSIIILKRKWINEKEINRKLKTMKIIIIIITKY